VDCGIEQCPYDCHGRGKCVDLKCVCNAEYSGDDCGVRTCENDCNNAGWCNDGVCECFPGVVLGKDGQCTVQSLYREIEGSCAVDCVTSCMSKCEGDHSGLEKQVSCLDECTSGCLTACGGGV
jgi:syndecan 4